MKKFLQEMKYSNDGWKILGIGYVTLILIGCVAGITYHLLGKTEVSNKILEFTGLFFGIFILNSIIFAITIAIFRNNYFEK